MTDKELIEALRNYAKSYTNGNPYNFNPGIALMVSNRMEQLVGTSVDEKFNIGDRVWVPDNFYDEWYVINKEGFIIDGIKIHIDSHGHKIKMYTLRDNNGFYEYPPRLCFNNYDECQQWCDKENRLQ